MKGWKPNPALAGAVLLVWSGVIIWLCRPRFGGVLAPDALLAPLSRVFLASLLFVAALGASAFGVGGAVFSRLLPRFGSLLEEWLFKTALGLILVSYAVFLLAISGLLYPAAGFVLLAAAIAAGLNEIRRLIKRASHLRPSFGVSAAGILLGGISFYFLLNGLLGALKPPTGFDVLMYHIGVPRLYLDAHRMFPTPDINGSAFPFGAEMLYLLGMMADGTIAANMVNYSFAVLAGLAAASFTRRFLGGASPLAPFAVFVSVPLIVWLMPQAYIELAMGFYSMMAIYATITAFEEKDGRWLALAALMSGFTVAMKYTGVLLVGLLAAAALFQYILVEKRGAAGAAPVARFLLISAAVSLAWYVRSYVYYSNPVYPFMAGVFNGVRIPSVDVGVSYADYWSGGPATVAYKLVSTLWNTTLNPEAYKVSWASGQGPYFLMFIPGIALFTGIPRALKYLLFITLALYFIILFAAQENLRYLTPALPALAVLAGYPIGRLVIDKSATRKYAGVALAAVLAFSALTSNAEGLQSPDIPAYGTAGEDAYYEAMSETQGYLTSYTTWKWINANLPEDAVIYQLWDDASVFFRGRKTIGSALPFGPASRNNVQVIRGYNGFGGFLPGREIIGNLRGMGAGYLLVNANREGNSLPEDPEFRQGVSLLHEDKGVFLFRLNP